jgi:hypothetical protein
MNDAEMKANKRMVALMTETAQRVLEIAIKYLGPGAEKFLDRQTKGHMDDLAFELIEPFHLEKLSFWIGVSAKLMLDKNKASEFAKKVAQVK